MKNIIPPVVKGTGLSGYTSSDVDKIGVKRERLKAWMEKGYIKPSIQSASGKGSKNIFSLWDLYMIRLFRRLVQLGFSRKDAEIRIKLCNLFEDSDSVPISSSTFLAFIRDKKTQDDAIETLSEITDPGYDFRELPKETRKILLDKYKDTLPTLIPQPIHGDIKFSHAFAGKYDSVLIINYEKIRCEVESVIT